MFDTRLTPARPDLAAAHLRGTVEAARFAEPVPAEVTVARAPLTFTPDGRARMETELLLGERFDVCERRGGWTWGQAPRDGYVGYVPAAALGPVGTPPTHRVAALAAHVHPAPDLKSRPDWVLPTGALVRVGADANGFAALAGRRYVALAHLVPADHLAPDWVAEAERFLGVPYLWGGRSGAGIDCSGLIQAALGASGRACPRDSDMQEAGLGRDLDPGERLQRGDLVFWRGHVGVMLSGTRMLHANAHHMAVVAEPLTAARRRMAATGTGDPTRRARLDGQDPGG